MVINHGDIIDLKLGKKPNDLGIHGDFGGDLQLTTWRPMGEPHPLGGERTEWDVCRGLRDSHVEKIVCGILNQQDVTLRTQWDTFSMVWEGKAVRIKLWFTSFTEPYHGGINATSIIQQFGGVLMLWLGASKIGFVKGVEKVPYKRLELTRKQR